MDELLSPLSVSDQEEDGTYRDFAPQQPVFGVHVPEHDADAPADGGRAPGDVADYIVPQPLHTTAIIPAPVTAQSDSNNTAVSASSTALSQSALPAASTEAANSMQRVCMRDPAVVRARKYVSYWREPSDALSPGPKFGKFGEDDGPPRIVSDELRKQLNSADYAYGSPYRASHVARRQAAESEAAAIRANLARARAEAVEAAAAQARAVAEEADKAAAAATAASTASAAAAVPPPPPPHPAVSIDGNQSDGGTSVVSIPTMVSSSDDEDDVDGADGADDVDENPPAPTTTPSRKPSATPSTPTSTTTTTPMALFTATTTTTTTTTPATPTTPTHSLLSPKPPRPPSSGSHKKPTVDTSMTLSTPVDRDVRAALAALEKADRKLASRSVAQRRRSSVSTLRSRRSSVSSGGGGGASKFKRRLSVNPDDLPKEADPVDVFKLFAPEDIAFSPPAAARARAEAMKLLATERRAKRDALSEVESLREELVQVKKQARKDASQRAHIERCLREARDSAEARTNSAEGDRQKLESDLAASRTELEDTHTALSEERTRCRELDTRCRAQEEASASMQASLSADLAAVESRLGPLEASKDMYEKRWRDAEARIIDADRRARVAQEQSAEAELKLREATALTEKSVEAQAAADLQRKVVEEEIKAANDQKRMLEKQILDLDGQLSRSTEVTGRVERAQQQTEDKLESTLAALDQTRAALSQMEAALDLERRRGQTLEEEIVELNSSRSDTCQIQAREVADLKLRLETEQLGRIRAEKAKTTAEFRQKLETERANELEGERSKLEDTIQELQGTVATLRRQLNDTEGNLGMTVKSLMQERESSKLIQTQVVKEKSLREDVTFARRASVVSVADSRSSVETECELAVAKAAKSAAEGRVESVEARARAAENRLEAVLRERRVLQNERSELAAQVANLEEQLLAAKRSEVSMSEMEKALKDAEVSAADAKADLMDRIRDMELRTPNPDAVRELVERERQARLAAEKLAQEERAARRRAEATWTRAERELRLSLAEMSDSQNRADRRYQNAKQELQRMRDGVGVGVSDGDGRRSRSPVHRRPRSMSMVSGASAVSRGRSGSPVRRRNGLRSPASSVRSGIGATASIGAAPLVLESRTAAAEAAEFSNLVAAMQDEDANGRPAQTRSRGNRRRTTRSKSRGATSSGHHTASTNNHQHHQHHSGAAGATSSRSRSKSPAAHRIRRSTYRNKFTNASRFTSRPASASPRRKNPRALVSSSVQLFGYHSRCMHPHGA